MKCINEIKSLAAKKGLTLTYIAKELSRRLNKDYTLNNLSGKLRKETIKYSEIKIIAEILGYNIEFIEQE